MSLILGIALFVFGVGLLLSGPVWIMITPMETFVAWCVSTVITVLLAATGMLVLSLGLLRILTHQIEVG